jgi:signal peptidase
VDGDTVTVARVPAGLADISSHGDGIAGHAARSRRLRVPRKVARLALNLVFLAMIVCAGLMLGPAALGFHRYVILTGSMTGTYDRGSIVFDRPVPVAGLKVGDPITYSPPPGFTSQQRVTHRIWWIGRGTGGQRAFRTKGDANKAPDAWKFSLAQPTQDRVVFHVPYVGYLFKLLSLRTFRMVLVGLPALMIGLWILRGLWRDAGEEARRQKLAEIGWQQVVDPGVEIALAPLASPAVQPGPVRVDLRLQPSAPRAPRPRPGRVTAATTGAPCRLRVRPLSRGVRAAESTCEGTRR